MNLIEIDKNSEEGFQDLEFSINSNFIYEDGTICFEALGQYRGKIVGFKLSVAPNMEPGILNGNINNTAFYYDGITILPIENYSNNFIEGLSDLYNVKVTEKINEGNGEF